MVGNATLTIVLSTITKSSAKHSAHSANQRERMRKPSE